MTVPQSAIAAGAPQRPARDFARALGQNARLAAPVCASRLVMFLIITADVAMVGRHDSVQLAFISLAMAVQGVLMLVGFGMLVGTGVLAAQARGAGADAECGVIWRVALLHALGLGLLFLALCGAGEGFFLLAGQDPMLAAGGGRTLLWLGLGLPGLLLAMATSLFLEALGRPVVTVVVAAGALALNIVLNGMLIETRGADGAAMATSAVRWAMAVALIGYALATVDARYNLRGALRHGGAIGRKLRRLGYALGLAQGLESAAFSALTLLAGLIGAGAVAAHQIAMQVAAFCFMAAVGTSTATAVQVGMAVGRGDRRGVALAGWAGVCLILSVMLALGVLIVALQDSVAGLFTEDPAVQALVLPVLVVVAAMLAPDGLQGVLMGALRGAGDVWVPTAMQLVSFVAVMAPLAAWLGLGLGWGVPGLYAGALCGVTLAAALLGARFAVVSRRAVRRL
jgi:MATE family multidrug resistance protein